jgi:hypothetical protein
MQLWFLRTACPEIFLHGHRTFDHSLRTVPRQFFPGAGSKSTTFLHNTAVSPLSTENPVCELIGNPPRSEWKLFRDSWLDPETAVHIYNNRCQTPESWFLKLFNPATTGSSNIVYWYAVLLKIWNINRKIILMINETSDISMWQCSVLLATLHDSFRCQPFFLISAFFFNVQKILVLY